MPIIDFKSFVKVIKADLYRYGGATGTGCFCKTYAREPGFRYTFWMRMAGQLRCSKLLKVLYFIACCQRHRLEVKYGISIPHTTTIGPGLFIGHFGGIVVSDHASIGRNCNLSHGVTIGQRNRGEYKGYPSIGDSVYIGPGVSIIGSVSVGSNVAIGANAVVVKNVEDNAVVVGNPARTISTEGSRDYVNWTLDDEQVLSGPL